MSLHPNKISLSNFPFLSCADDTVTPPSSEHGGSETLEIQIRPHPQHSSLNKMAIKNLETSPMCTVSHLLRFIKLNLDSEALKGKWTCADVSHVLACADTWHAQTCADMSHVHVQSRADVTCACMCRHLTCMHTHVDICMILCALALVFSADSTKSVQEHDFSLHVQVGEEFSNLASPTTLQQISRMVSV